MHVLKVAAAGYRCCGDGKNTEMAFPNLSHVVWTSLELRDYLAQ